MKLNRILTFIATFLVGVTGALFMSQQNVNAKTVARAAGNSKYVRLYDFDGKQISNRALVPNTDWLVGRIFTHNNETFYQVATNEYMKANDSSKLFNNDYGSWDYTPNIQRINQYFIKYLNALHAANGTAPVVSTPDLFEYANHRAYKQVGKTMNHATGERQLEECLYSIGFTDILKYAQGEGWKNDRDVAWYLIKGWYDDDNNAMYSEGQPGHFGHRAALIYTSDYASLGMSDNSTAFEAIWPDNLDGFYSVYNYTGTNPDTKFISKDVVSE